MSGQARRKVCKSGRLASTVTLPEVLALQHLPIELAAAEVGVCVTTFKKVCRKLGIMRWPFRSNATKMVHQKGQLLPLLPQHQLPYEQQQQPLLQMPSQGAFAATSPATAAATAAGSPTQPHTLAQAVGGSATTRSGSSGGSYFGLPPCQQAGRRPSELHPVQQALGQLLQALAGPGASQPAAAHLQRLVGHLQHQHQQQQALQRQQDTIAELLWCIIGHAGAAAAPGPPGNFANILPPSAVAAAPDSVYQLLQHIDSAGDGRLEWQRQACQPRTLQQLQQLLSLTAQHQHQHQATPVEHSRIWGLPLPPSTAAAQPHQTAAAAVAQHDLPPQRQLQQVPPVASGQPAKQEQSKQADGLPGALQLLTALMGSLCRVPRSCTT